ncbi:MAG: multidrug efflux RND transporter permease subunit [Candidatus Accumulibacter sp.]|uniref:efflux RND transporter permease subunit n=1 Tax=Accumulibacter sp. TaxID=2053492 RepID=UPI001AD34DA6|nr:multidrug efflux RND transporter permease subunit [Accumulibacter sp.]MBN8519984.1 multidrug efflux RND transporter permease subunit [Accumulibacter sp.]MBO3713079.1 multidrug efflux RND transporter permease subunit [Accumulibacter sp.]MCC2868118.1 multidrug efflux RND transporter permease subunit [Candidatus Accumulibacter phosphatis]
MFSRFFIDRPIFAVVISVLLIVAGLAAMRSLPIAQYPEIAPPVVTVQATYPGASAEVLESTVAAPLENAINGLPGMIYMSSNSSSNGLTQIQVTFEIGTQIDIAAVNVSNRVKQVESRLPLEVRRQGVTVEPGSSAFLQVLAFYSPDGRYDDLFTSNYVTLNVLDRLKRLPGTTNVQIFGAKDYAMRIWLKPDRLAQLKLTPGDVASAINEQNAQFAAGKVGQSPISKGQDLVYTVTSKGRLADPAQFREIIVRANPDGSTVRLDDVARVELGSRDYEFNGRYNGQPATLVGIFLSPGANALDVAKSVLGTVDELQQRFPEGLSYAVPYDTTRFVKVSIEEVLKTLGEAMLLVFLVVYLFLQSWRAAIIPFAAVPVSLIGTFAGIYLLGYSINTLTLFGMVLAIGIVVDDAIVVLENVERIMREQGLPPRDAAVQAMHEVTGPIIAIVLTLTAVFVPIAFLGGLTGELYRQFAVTISISVVLSGIVALTLSPSLCVIMLKHGHRPPNRFFRWFNAWFARVTGHYLDGVVWMIRRAARVLLLFAGMVAITAFLWRTTPGSLVPEEDQGFFISAVILPDGATLERTTRVVEQVEAAVRSNPDNQDVVAFAGFDFIGGGFRNNAATLFVTQKPWHERQTTSQQLVGELFMKTAGIREALVLAFNPPAIFGLGTAGGYEFFIQNRGDGGPRRLQEVLQQFLARANSDPQLGGAQTLWRASVPQLFVDVDREKAKKAGVAIDEVFAALSSTLGTYYVNDFNKYGRTWQVLMSAEPEYRKRPDDIEGLYVRSQKGEMVPLSALVNVKHASGPDSLDRFNNLPAVKVIGQTAPGISSGQGIARVEQIAKEVLPPDFSFDWGGSSYQEKKSSGASTFALGLAVVMVFLILAAQYEKWSLPLSVLLALPFGTFGALVAIWAKNLIGPFFHATPLTNDVYFQIGLVTLLGLAAKNAILIVEFAVLKHAEGLSASASAIEAARLRFRPILMTSLAFILGVLPLAISTGAGAGARHSVGTGVMGGMIAATLLAVFHVPLFFKVLYDRRIRETRSHDELLDEVRHLHHVIPVVPPAPEPLAKGGEHD